MRNLIVVFDLDDTLYKEIEFVKSGFHYIASIVAKRGIPNEDAYSCLFNSFINGSNAFEQLNSTYDLDIPIIKYIEWYRFHNPKIILSNDKKELLDFLTDNGMRIGLITDGRSVTQRNKIKALGLENYFHEENIVISEEFGCEKPSERNYKYFMERFPEGKKFMYVGDNVKKDFITPNKLSWYTVGIKDNGPNIHKSQSMAIEYQPHIWLSNIAEIKEIVNRTLL